jgi:hypothetical protein
VIKLKTETPRPRAKSELHLRPRRQSSPISLREVSADDIIKGLLDLFEFLGIDASHLAARVTNLDTAKLASRRLYPHAAAIGDLLTAWHQDPNYLDKLGNPAPIKMTAARVSFSRLANKAAPHLDAKKLLFELESVGAVTIDKKRLIRVQMRSLPVYHDKRLAAQHTLTALDGFIKTLRHNLVSVASNSDQLFHRIAFNGEFDANDIPALKIKVKRHGQNFLESCDNWIMQRSKSAVRKSKRRIKSVQVSIGVYLAVDRV